MTKYQIEAPVRSFTGESVGVAFSKGTGYVTDQEKTGRAALEYFRRHGYGVSTAPEHTAEEAVQALVTGTPPRSEADGEYDPGAYKPAEVLDYLNGADYDEAVRVLDAEAAGKKRTTIVSHRDAVLDSKTPAAPVNDDSKGPQA